LVGFTVGMALLGIVVWGTLIGSTLPFLLKKLGADPAMSSAPFAATLVDVTGLIIDFNVALLILRGVWFWHQRSTKSRFRSRQEPDPRLLYKRSRSRRSLPDAPLANPPPHCSGKTPQEFQLNRRSSRSSPTARETTVGGPHHMNLTDALIDEIRGQAYLIDHDDDVEGRRESVRQMLRVTAEQRSAGLSEADLRALFEESMWNDVRRLRIDPGSLNAETILAVGTRMVEACLNATRRMSIPA
jgi:hypothetical protein